MSLPTESLKETVARKLSANPSMKTAMLAETLGVAELEILRVMPNGTLGELDATRAEEILRACERLETIYFVSRNPAVVQEVKGKFGEFSRSGPFLNVSTEKLHLHIKIDKIKAILAMETPGREGAAAMKSLQFFQPDGEAAFKVFIIEGFKKEAGESYETACEALHQLINEFGIYSA